MGNGERRGVSPTCVSPMNEAIAGPESTSGLRLDARQEKA